MNAKIDWVDGQPYSSEYGDVYFSRENGLEETRHVFIENNDLPSRWKNLDKHVFTIAETGFGTGLNFLCAWQLWKQISPQHARLHFISTEKHPLSQDDLTQALQLWPELKKEAETLIKQYKWLSSGWHRLVFDHGNVTLTLVIGDISETIPEIRAHVDAWFLDGFSPAQNPDMWQETLFSHMARLSHDGTTFATFTSAGFVKRGLDAAGFNVQKVTGHGRKREMLRGTFSKDSEPARQVLDQQAIVIGGGISGTSTAHALVTRGWQVTLIERHTTLAAEASGNPAGVLYPRLSAKDCALDRMALHGYLYTLRLLGQFSINELYQKSGVLQLGFNNREASKIEAIAERNLPSDITWAVSSEEASQLSGINLTDNGLWFPEGGWLNPASLCNMLAEHPNITQRLASKAIQLIRQDNLWEVWSDSEKLAQAPVVIIAGANDSTLISQSAHIQLEPVRGQISLISATPDSKRLKAVLCTDGYTMPAINDVHCVGATFSSNDSDISLRDADNDANLTIFRKIIRDQTLAAKIKGGRAALRAVTPDYMPVTGQLLDAAQLAASPPRHSEKQANLPWLSGLYINAGHGAKGLVNAPICSEMITSHICGEPAPVGSKLLSALDPNRYLLKNMGLRRLVSGLAG